MNKGNPYAKLYALLKVKLCLQACVKNEPVLKEDIQENISLQSPTQGTHEIADMVAFDQFVYTKHIEMGVSLKRRAV